MDKCFAAELGSEACVLHMRGDACQDQLLKFWRWVDEHFPPVKGVPGAESSLQVALRWPLREYAQKGDLKREQGIIARPWMLNFAPDMGMKGLLEPAPASISVYSTDGDARTQSR